MKEKLKAINKFLLKLLIKILYITILISLGFGLYIIYQVSNASKADAKVNSYAEFPRTIKRVIDGDTVELDASDESDLIDHLGYDVRILGIDTPEKRTKKACEKALGLKAKQFLIEYLGERKKVKLIDPKWDKYGGRILADIEIDGVLISQLMIDKGFAVPYQGEKKTKIWCK
jgi:endonuclease YncB( thermonuclease family)